MALSSLLPKIFIGITAGAAIGGATYLGINSSSKNSNSKDIKNKSMQEKVDNKKLIFGAPAPEVNIDKKIKVSSPSFLTIEEVLAEYVLVNKNLKGCQRILDGGDKESVIGCEYPWAKDMLSELKEKDGWILRGRKDSVNTTVSGWKWFKNNLGLSNLKNYWIKEGEGNTSSLIQGNSCSKTEDNKGIYEMKIVCLNSTN